MSAATPTELRDMLHRFLVENKSALHPGKGKKNAMFVKEVCDLLNIEDDPYQQHYVLADRKKWGAQR